MTRLRDPRLQVPQFIRGVTCSVSDKPTQFCNTLYLVARNKVCVLQIVLKVPRKDTDYGATCGELLEVTVEDTPYVVANLAHCVTKQATP
jgi:hypothetical protein